MSIVKVEPSDAAPYADQEQIVEPLLQYGADLNASAECYGTEIDLASNFETLQLCEAAGPIILPNKPSHSIASATARTNCRFLSLPLELREQIYNYTISRKQRRLCGAHPPDRCCDLVDIFHRRGQTHHDICGCCHLFNIIYCNRQILHEVSNVLSRRPLRFQVSAGREVVRSNISCARILKFLTPRIVKINIKASRCWYVPYVWESFLSLCQMLRRNFYSTKLEIRCKTTESGMEPEYDTTDADLTRDQREMLLVLQPLDLVLSFEHVKIFMLGTHPSNSWSKNVVLQEFAARLAARMEGRTPVQMDYIMALPYLRCILTNKEWQDSWRLLHSDEDYAAFLRAARIWKLENPSNMNQKNNKNQSGLPFTCTVCNKTFESRNRLFVHLRALHTNPQW